jgi:hypothetical protein
LLTNNDWPVVNVITPFIFFIVKISFCTFVVVL